MANTPLINLSQLKQDQLGNFVDTRLLIASGEIFATITGSQVQTGNFDTRYVGTTGDQTISGVKNFANRPLIFNTGVLLTGETLSPFQTGQLASSGNLQETGRNIRSQIVALSGLTGTFTGAFYPLTGNTSGFSRVQVTGSANLDVADIIGIVGGQVGVDGNRIIVSGDVRTTGVLSIRASGGINTGSYTGDVGLSGGGNSIVYTGQYPFLNISGNTGVYSNFLTPSNIIGVPSITTTGYFPSGLRSGNINLTGAGTVFIYTGVNGNIVISGDKVGVKSLASTGSFNTGYFTGDLMLSGSQVVVVYTGNVIDRTIVISGDSNAFNNFLTTGQTGQFALPITLEATGSNLQNQLERPTGNICIFDSGIQQSVTVQSFQFPILFNSPPFIFTQLKYLGNTGAGLPIIGISGVTSSGFSGVYNRAFNTTGYFLNIMAMSGATTGSINPTDPLLPLVNWWEGHPDRPPDNPSNWNDEFTYTGTLSGGDSGKWTFYNHGNGTVKITGHHLRAQDVGAGDSVCLLWQPISGSTTTGNPWAITTKVSFNDTTYKSFNKFGLLASGTGSNFIFFGVRGTNNDTVSHTLTLGLYTSPSASSESNTNTILWDRDIYFRMLNTGAGAGLFYQYSKDGYNYITLYSGNTTAHINHTISNVGLFFDAINAASTFADFDFFRLQTGIFF
jgi:hypothetical protein